MRGLEDRELLDVWTRARALHPIDRTLLLLAAALGSSTRELATVSLGERNVLALELRERTFGTELACFATCPACATATEFTISTRDLAGQPASAVSLELDVEDHHLVLRRLDSRDLAAIAGVGQRETARALLLERCVVSATRAGEAVPVSELPPAVVAAIAERLVAVEPLLDTRFELTCPSCPHVWSAPFDPGAFLWNEVSARARRLLRDVHELALLYGWTESAVLAIPAARRQAYLQLAGVA